MNLFVPVSSVLESENRLLDRAEDAGPVIKAILSAIASRRGASGALQTCYDLIAGKCDEKIRRALLRLSPQWRDHAIASVYATLMPGDRRKKLGAYFTPPHLVDHLIFRLQEFGLDLSNDRFRDPAAGGAAFLVPLARHKARIWREKNIKDERIVQLLTDHLEGCEVDAGLAQLANSLLRRMLSSEFSIAEELVESLEIVKTEDSLEDNSMSSTHIVHEIGNPPYFRLPRAAVPDQQARFGDISSGRLNLYAMFVRKGLDRIPAGGLAGYVIPTSFLGGPEFRRFRSRVNELAEVLVIDLIDKRSDVFLDATQDACFIVLRRRSSEVISVETTEAKSGLLASNGIFTERGKATIYAGGEPWWLPGEETQSHATLADWGYTATIGYLVANRQSERLHKTGGAGRFPLIWAKAVTPTGEFDFLRGVVQKGFGWVDAPSEARYVVKSECIAIQRTSSRGQKRRVTAALIPKDFVEMNGGVVAENHVILLIPNREHPESASNLVQALNSAAVSDQLDRICGSASISVRLLEKLKISKAQ